MNSMTRIPRWAPQVFSVFTLLILLFGLQPTIAQEGEASPVDGEENKIANYPGLDGDKRNDMPGPDVSLDDDDQTQIFPNVWCEEIKSDEETARICWEAYRAGLAYYEWGLSHREDVLWWQHISTRAIFFVVLVLVGIGVFFAWVQFRSGLSSETSHEVEVSLKGIKVSSPVLGVIILTLSLVFFYLYLRYVYPVQEII